MPKKIKQPKNRKVAPSDSLNQVLIGIQINLAAMQEIMFEKNLFTADELSRKKTEIQQLEMKRMMINWSNTGNWSLAHVPTTADVATFDNTCTNCNVTVDTGVMVSGFNILSNTELAGWVKKQIAARIGPVEIVFPVRTAQEMRAVPEMQRDIALQPQHPGNEFLTLAG